MADLTSIIQNGTAATRIDVTFVAEGYTLAERDKFLADVAKFSDYMFSSTNSLLNAPFSNYKQYFNVNALFVASNQSRWEVTSGMVDTYFKANSYLDDGRLVYGDSVKVYETVRDALPANAQEITIVLVNSKAYGGSGGGISWATTGNLASAEVLLHELGHSVANLGDEYIDSSLGSTPLTSPFSLANVSTEKNAPPWQAWMGYEDTLGKVGVFEGGYYRATGVWRATQDSKMLSLGKPFNAPQKEALALAVYDRVGDYLSIDTRIPGLGIATVPDQRTVTLSWTQAGTDLVNGKGAVYDIYGSGKYVKDATITLSAIDSTGLIRTGLSATRQTETLTLQGTVELRTGAVQDIAQGGSVFRFDRADNTINVHNGVGASYFDGGIGADTVVLNLARSEVTLEKLATGSWLVSQGSAPLMALRNVEMLHLSNATVMLVELQSGGAGNDRIDNRAGSEMIDGGTGTDIVVYAGARSGFTVEQSGSGFTVTDAVGGHADVLANVERLAFGDAAIALDIAGVGGQAYRLYQAAFQRTPDSAGLGYWIAMMDGGVGLRQVAEGFVSSDEFRSVYGASPGNVQIVEKLYQNILNRPGDAAGVAFWLGILDKQMDSVAGVLAAFSESPENTAALATVIGNGFQYTPYGA